MQVTIQKSALSEILSVSRFAAPKSAALPALEGVLLKAENGRLTACCTTIDTMAEASADAEVAREGAVLLPAKIFVDLVKVLPDGPVTLTKEENDVLVSYDGSRTMLRGYPAEQFPEPPSAEGDVEFVLSGEKFRDMLRGVSYAALADKTRPIFTGVLFELKNGRLRLVATDTHRLAWKEANVQTEGEARVIVPCTELEKAVALLAGETVVVSLGKTHVNISAADAGVTLRLIAGVYPDYEKVVPGNFISEIKVDKNRLEDALKRIILFLDAEPVVHFVIKEDTLTASHTSAGGSVNEKLNIEKSGADVEIRFNCHYLLEALRIVNTEKTLLKLTGPRSAALIYPAGESGGLSLLLPAIPKGSEAAA